MSTEGSEVWMVMQMSLLDALDQDFEVPAVFGSLEPDYQGLAPWTRWQDVLGRYARPKSKETFAGLSTLEDMEEITELDETFQGSPSFAGHDAGMGWYPGKYIKGAQYLSPAGMAWNLASKEKKEKQKVEPGETFSFREMHDRLHESSSPDLSKWLWVGVVAVGLAGTYLVVQHYRGTVREDVRKTGMIPGLS